MTLNKPCCKLLAALLAAKPGSLSFFVGPNDCWVQSFYLINVVYHSVVPSDLRLFLLKAKTEQIDEISNAPSISSCQIDRQL